MILVLFHLVPGHNSKFLIYPLPEEAYDILVKSYIFKVLSGWNTGHKNFRHESNRDYLESYGIN